MGRLERLRARRRPSVPFELAAGPGGETEQLELRALLPQQWDELVEAHPPTPEQATLGALWDLTSFRPALIAESVVTPAGEEPLSAADWADLATGGHITGPEYNRLFNVCYELNDRSPQVSVGKG